MALLRRVIGRVLRRVRLRQGRTLRDVAGAAGVSVPYLSEVERGRKEASSEVLAAVCRALGIRLSDLLEEVRDDLCRLEPATPVPPARAAARPVVGTQAALAPRTRFAPPQVTTRRPPTWAGRIARCGRSPATSGSLRR